MKKLITILSAISLTTSTSAVVVACANSDEEQWKYDESGLVILKSIKGLTLDMGEIEGDETIPRDFKYKIGAVFVEKNKDLLPEGTVADDLYVATASIDPVAKTATVTGSNSSKTSKLSFAEGNGVQVTFTPVAPTVPEGKIQLSQVDGIDWDMGTVDWPIKEATTTSGIRPNSWKDPINAFLTANSAVPELEGFTIDNFAISGSTANFGYNNSNNVDSTAMTITFNDNHPKFSGSIQIKYQLTKPTTPEETELKISDVKSKISTVNDLADLNAVNAELAKYATGGANAITGVQSLTAALKDGSTTDVTVTAVAATGYKLDSATFDIAGAIKTTATQGTE